MAKIPQTIRLTVNRAKIAKYIREEAERAKKKVRREMREEIKALKKKAFDDGFTRGMGIALSNLWSESRDSRLVKNVACGMKFRDFVGTGMLRSDIENIRQSFKS